MYRSLFIHVSFVQLFPCNSSFTYFRYSNSVYRQILTQIHIRNKFCLLTILNDIHSKQHEMFNATRYCLYSQIDSLRLLFLAHTLRLLWESFLFYFQWVEYSLENVSIALLVDEVFRIWWSEISLSFWICRNDIVRFTASFIHFKIKIEINKSKKITKDK